MVRVKAKLWHAEVRPVQCVVIVYKNQICYSIRRFKEYFIRDKKARRKKQYKDHVHTTPEKLPSASSTEKAVNSRCYTESTDPTKLERRAVGYRNSYQLQRNSGKMYTNVCSVIILREHKSSKWFSNSRK